MRQFIHNIVRRLVGHAAHRISIWLRRMEGAGDRPPRQPPQEAAPALPEVGQTPPDDLSPEEEILLRQLPPIAKVKRHVIVPISEAGEMVELSEEIRMTRLGKVVARTEFLTMDGNNTIGHASQVKGQCTHCGRFSFQGQQCVCGRFICQTCAVPFEDKDTVLLLCPDCAHSANWSKETWK